MSLTVNKSEKVKRPAHHANDSATAFKNPWPSASTPTWGELLKLSFPLGWYPSHPPSEQILPVKVVMPDWGAPALQQRTEESKSKCIVATWLGHAGTMAQFPPLTSTDQKKTDDQGVYLIFDPIFSFRAGPTQYTGPARFRKSPCQAEDLPGCHAAFISHNHYDHMDLASVLGITRRFPTMKWFVPLGNKTWFLGEGVKAENVIQLDWWQTWEGSFPDGNTNSTNEGNAWFKITCVPAQHNTGRWGFDAGSTLWCGWVVERFPSKDQAKNAETRQGAVYHAGDTGYRRVEKSKDVCPAFKEIGDRFNGFDLSFVPIWRGGSLSFISYAGVRLLHGQVPSAFHCSPEDSVNIHKDVKSKNTVAIHFGTFVGSEQESDEAALEFYEACTKADIQSLDSSEVAVNGRAGKLDIGGSQIFDIE